MASSIDEFVGRVLADDRIAIVGVSRNPTHYSRLVFDEFRRRGHRVFAVNPNAPEIDFTEAVARIADLDPAPAAAILLTPPSEVEGAAADCIAAGVERVWIRRPAKPGSPEKLATEQLQRNGIPVITGVCPFMVLPDTALFHRFHGLIARWTNTVGEAHGGKPADS